jgi:hypothetical protein
MCKPPHIAHALTNANVPWSFRRPSPAAVDVSKAKGYEPQDGSLVNLMPRLLLPTSPIAVATSSASAGIGIPPRRLYQTKKLKRVKTKKLSKPAALLPVQPASSYGPGYPPPKKSRDKPPKKSKVKKPLGGVKGDTDARTSTGAPYSVPQPRALKSEGHATCDDRLSRELQTSGQVAAATKSPFVDFTSIRGLALMRGLVSKRAVNRGMGTRRTDESTTTTDTQCLPNLPRLPPAWRPAGACDTSAHPFDQQEKLSWRPTSNEVGDGRGPAE